MIGMPSQAEFVQTERLAYSLTVHPANPRDQRLVTAWSPTVWAEMRVEENLMPRSVRWRG